MTDTDLILEHDRLVRRLRVLAESSDMSRELRDETIREADTFGIPQSRIAALTGLTQQRVSQIVRRR